MPSELRNIKVSRSGIIDAEISWSRDFSPGQIELTEAIVTVQAAHRPVRVLRYPLKSQTRLTVDNLEPETGYKILVQATNIVGTSPVSREISLKTKKLGKNLKENA